MRYPKLPSTLFIRNRKIFASKMIPSSIAILTSNDIMPINADDLMGFAQNNNMFYIGLSDFLKKSY